MCTSGNINNPGMAKKNLYFLLTVSAAILLIFYNLWVPSIWNPNEAFYAEAAREMLETGDFLVPHFNYEPRFQKPVLLYWLVSASYLIFGTSEFAVRIVSAVLASGTILITFLTGRLICKSTRGGLLSAVVLATSFEFNQAARYTSPEMPLLFFIAFALYAFLEGLTRSNRFWFYVSYVCMGLAVLTKGPVGVILPLLCIAVYLVVIRRWDVLSKIRLHCGIPIIIFIAAPWFLFMIHTFGEQYTSVVFGENVKRFMGGYGKSSNIFYYFSVLPWNFFPWFPFLIFASISFVKDFIRKNLDEKDVFIGVWFLVVFGFFSLSAGKLPPYLLPLFPAASVLVGRFFDSKIENEESSGKVLMLLALFIFLLIISAVVFLSLMLGLSSYSLISGLLFFFLPAVFIFKYRKPSGIFLSTGAAMLVFLFFFLSFILPHIEMKRPYRLIGDKINNYDPQKKSGFFALGYLPDNFPYYAKRQVRRLNNIDAVEFKNMAGPKIVMLRESDYLKAGNGIKKSCGVLDRFQLYTKSESRFLKLLLSLKSGKDFENYILLTCGTESNQH